MTAGLPRALVIGGGFYGASVAEALACRGCHVLLVEREAELLTRASYVNQARLHGGYHYPRSFSTAYRSRLNLDRFTRDFAPAVVRSFLKIYAIAKVGSLVTARQFERFCANIGAPLRPLHARLTRLFNPRLIEAAYEAEEFVFDAAVLRRLVRDRLDRAGVEVRLGVAVTGVARAEAGLLTVRLADGTDVPADRVVNCTYSGLNSIPGIGPTRTRLKHEITELALIQLPPELEGTSVTVMDGPFFSFMPFPDRGQTTLSHVRYTPHAAWEEEPSLGVRDPYAALAAFAAESSFPFMVRDAARYVPCLRDATYAGSLFEVKSVLVRNEADDGRPVLFEADAADPRVVSMLGSKIDNVYDALTAMEEYLAAA